MMLERLRDRAEDFLEALAREWFRARSRQTRQPELAEVYGRHSDLFHLDRIPEVQRILAGATGEEEQSARFLLEFLVDGRSAWASAGARDRLLTWATNASAVVGEERVPVRDVKHVLAETSLAEERWVLDEARLEALDDVLELLEAIYEREHEVVGELGYGTYLDAREVVGGISFRSLAQEGARFLEETDALYRELLAFYLPRVTGVAPGEARAADVPRLERAETFDGIFSGTGMVSAVRDELQKTGMDPFADGRIRFEVKGGAAERRTFAQPLRVPDAVVLTVFPRPGRNAYATYLRELGSALQLAYSAIDLPVEFRWMGDEAVTLGWGLLLEGLLDEPAWLHRVHGTRLEGGGDYLRFSALLELFHLRREIAQLQYEIELHGSTGLGGQAEIYAELLTRATGLRHDPRDYLWSVEPGFRIARRVRAAQLEALLSGYLRDRFDEDWFRNPRTGERLLDLFAQGRRYTAGEVAVQLASQPLSFDILRRRLEERAR